jgi:hypothetical protein
MIVYTILNRCDMDHSWEAWEMCSKLKVGKMYMLLEKPRQDLRIVWHKILAKSNHLLSLHAMRVTKKRKKLGVTQIHKKQRNLIKFPLFSEILGWTSPSVSCEPVFWICLAQDRDQFETLVKALLNVRTPLTVGEENGLFFNGNINVLKSHFNFAVRRGSLFLFQSITLYFSLHYNTLISRLA